MKIEFSGTKPIYPGYYLTRFKTCGHWWGAKDMFSVDLVKIVQGNDGLVCPGRSTHFTRWHCEWSEAIDIGSPIEDTI